MFDTMTVTKAGGALCGSLLVFLLGNWAATSLYATSAGGHGTEPAKQAYVIDTGAAEAGAPAETGPDFATLFASADAAAGEKVFAKCKACHKVDGNNITGPHLDGVVGRPHGSAAGFNYSDAMKALSDQPWTPEALSEFLTNPRGAIPGNKMSFAGLPKAEDRANLIKYLESLGS